MRERVPLFSGLALLAIAVVVGSLFIAGGIRDRNRTDVITVTGSAKARIVSDYIVWDASLTGQGRALRRPQPRRSLRPGRAASADSFVSRAWCQRS
jgi:hypothetical protein